VSGSCRDLPPTPAGCASNADCLALADTRVCNAASGQCVQCVRDADCGSANNTKACENFACVDRPGGCADDADCGASPLGKKCKASTRLCVQCLGNIDCPQGAVCQQNACVVTNGQCADSTACKDPTPVCDTATRTCVGCLAAPDCAPGKRCVNRACVDAGCSTSNDCAQNPAAPVCDLSSRKCVACNVAADCNDPTLTCENKACVPVPGCTSDTSCAATPATARCDAATGQCVACLVDTHCAAAEQCVGNRCQPRPPTGCTSDVACVGRPGTPRCDLATGACVACVTGGDCSASGRCDAASKTCLPGCASDAFCAGTTPKCDPATNGCVGCLANGDCGTGRICTGNACVPGCAGNSDCSGATPKCLVATSSCVACLAPADCPNGQTCTNNACVPLPTGGDAACGTNDACPAGKACIANADGTKLCRTTCAPYAPGSTCGTDKVCTWVGLGASAAPAGACLPRNGRGAPGATCQTFADCENDLLCIPSSATQGKCAKLCDPTGGTCGSGETCHALPSALVPPATSASGAYTPGRVATIGACYAAGSSWGRACSYDGTATSRTDDWSKATVRDEAAIYVAYSRSPGCGAGLTCSPAPALADPAVRLSMCQYTVGTGLASDACTDGSSCRSGTCIRAGTVSKPDVCATACYYTSDCAAQASSGGPALPSSYRCLAHVWSVTGGANQTVASATGQCLPTCASDADCSADRHCQLTTTFLNNGSSQSSFSSYCAPKAGNPAAPTPNRRSGAACTADEQCASNYCVRNAAGTDGYCFGVCNPSDTAQCDAARGVTCYPDVGFVLNFGPDGKDGTADDQFGGARVCAGKGCNRDADCAGLSADAARPRACAVSLRVNGANSNWLQPSDVTDRFTCEPRVGTTRAGGACTSDASCAGGFCFTFANQKRGCYGPCLTTADCASGSSCSSGLCTPN
jgi:hypothetical protein